MKLWSSLRSRLILYSLAITFFVLVSLLGISFMTLRGFLRANLTETTRYKLRIAMDHIDRDMDRLVQLVNWCSVSTDVATFVSSSSKYQDDRRFKALSAYYSIRDAVYANGLDSYVDKLVVGGFEGHSIQFGILQGDMKDAEVARREYDKTVSHEDRPDAWKGLVPDPFKHSGGRSMIPVARGVYSDDNTNRALGFVFMAVNTDVVTRFLAGYDLEAGSRLYWGIGDETYEILDSRRLVPVEPSKAVRGLVSYKGQTSGWTLSQTMPTVQLTRQNQVFAWLLAIMAGFVLLLVLLLLISVNRTVNQPIALINRRVALVSKGDFSHDPDIEWDNELGDIGRALNRLSRDIEELIERRLEDEKAAKALEFRMLQNQINPHFLYNTLSAIKWMAEIQKAPGIAEMVSALATLLRHAARDSGSLVALDRELELVGEYCTIQRYRSANLFELEILIRDESLRRCQVVKFMLQPIVENAIMHGIEPKMAPGRVRIEVSRSGENAMRIDVSDDGVGIDARRIAEILKGDPQDSESFNRIGLHNVDERLKLAFGEGYGLSVESRKGEYTVVSVLLPCVPEPERHPPGDDTCSPC